MHAIYANIPMIGDRSIAFHEKTSEPLKERHLNVNVQTNATKSG